MASTKTKDLDATSSQPTRYRVAVTSAYLSALFCHGGEHLGGTGAQPHNRILVIDDDPTILAVLGDCLEDAGYEVHLLRATAEAMCAVRRLRPDLVVIDHLIGAAEGLRLLAELRAEADTRDLPVIMCSAARVELRRHAETLESYAAQVIEKPFELDDLLDQVARSLAVSWASAELDAPGMPL